MKSSCTSMHSSGMRTAGLLTDSQHRLPREGVCAQGGVSPGAAQGVCAQRVCPGGCLPKVDVGPGGFAHWGLPRECACSGGLPRRDRVSACGGGVWPHTHTPCERNDWQTGVKILSRRNFVAGGKIAIVIDIYLIQLKLFHCLLINSIKV